MPPPRTGFTFDDGSELDDETLRRFRLLADGGPVIAPDGLAVTADDLLIGAGLTPPSRRTPRVVPTETPEGTVYVPGEMFRRTPDYIGRPDSMVAITEDEAREDAARADAAAEAARRAADAIPPRDIAVPFPRSRAEAPLPATADVDIGTAPRPDGIIATPVAPLDRSPRATETRRVGLPWEDSALPPVPGMTEVDPVEALAVTHPGDAEAIRAHGGLPPTEIDPATGLRRTFPSWAAFDAWQRTLAERGAVTRAEADAAAEDRRRRGTEPAPGVRRGSPTMPGEVPTVSEEDAARIAATEAAGAEAGARGSEREFLARVASDRDAAGYSAARALSDVNARDVAEGAREEGLAALGVTPPDDSDEGMLASISRAAREFFGIEDPTPEEDAALAALLGGGDAAGGGPDVVAGTPAGEVFDPASSRLPPDIAGAPPGGRRGGRRPVGPPPVIDPQTGLPVAGGDYARFDPQTDTPGPSMLERSLRRAETATDLAIDHSDIETRGYEATSAAIRGAERARVENENTRRAAMGNARDRYRTAMERATAMTLDPEGWYHDRGVLGTIGAVIATAMGSFGSALTGGTNEAMSIINASIERDLLAQQNAIDQGHARAVGEANLMDMLAAEFGSREAAVAAARSAMLEDVAARVNAETAALGTPEAIRAGEEMHDGLISQAQAAAAEALRAEEDREIDLALRAAQAREAMADAARAERRAMGGAGAPSYETPTNERLDTANRLVDTAGMSLSDALASVGLDPALAGGASRAAEGSDPISAGAEAELSATLDAIDSIVGPPGADVPGVLGSGILSAMASSVPDAVMADTNPAAMRLRQELRSAVDLFARTRSGAAMPDNEFARLSGAILGANNEESLRNGLAILRRGIGARVSRSREGDDLSTAARALAASAGIPAED